MKSAIRNPQFAIATSVAFGLAYWALGRRLPAAAGAGLKWLSVAMLALVAWRRRARRRGGRWLVAALLAHSVGDVVLGLNRAWILFAIPPFLLGHLGYARAFWPWRRPWRAWPRSRRALALGVPALALGVGALLLPHLTGALAPAVVVYIGAISLMAILAQAADLGQGGRPGTDRVAAGSYAYLLSDAFIGLDAFVAPIPGAAYVTWPLYYGAQLLITTGYTAAARPDPEVNP